jgi:DNA adenine methylase
MTKIITPPLKWHGGKHYQAEGIITLMPPRCLNPNEPDPADPGWLHYVEPYAGGLAVLLALDPPGVSEVVNDTNAALMNFWRTIQTPLLFEQFRRRVEATPFSQVEWEAGNFDDARDAVDAAVRFFIRVRQSLAGRMDTFASLTKNRTRRGMNEQVSAWLGCVEELPAVHKRLIRVAILNGEALDVIRKRDGPRTLFYLDPPYLHETRVAADTYAHEMAESDHEKLLSTLARIEGRFLLSGYRSALYDRHAEANGWSRVEFGIANHAAGGKQKRRMVECLWRNY